MRARDTSELRHKSGTFRYAAGIHVVQWRYITFRRLEKGVSKWRLPCLVPRIKGKAVLLHELQQGISNRSALREEIIKRDVRVMGGGGNGEKH
jgi:hypothetical protein